MSIGVLNIIYDKQIKYEKDYRSYLARFGEHLTLEQLVEKCKVITKDAPKRVDRIVVDELNGIVIDVKGGNAEFLLNDYELFRRKVVKLQMLSSTEYENGDYFVQFIVMCG